MTADQWLGLGALVLAVGLVLWLERRER